MAIPGPPPKPQRRNRTPLTHGWTEIPDVPFTGGPELPPRRRNGRSWPAYARDRWQVWSAMPHAARWQASDWAYALDTLELVIRCTAEDAAVSLWTELRAREKAMATTWDARQSCRLKYVAPVDDSSVDSSVAQLDDYRNL